MYHVHREIDDMQLVIYRLYTAEIAKVQEWILVELRIVKNLKEVER